MLEALEELEEWEALEEWVDSVAWVVPAEWVATEASLHISNQMEEIQDQVLEKEQLKSKICNN